MESNRESFLDEVAKYYSNKLSLHGDTPQGVDWNGVNSQSIRFDQLCKIINHDSSHFSVNDIGCGYGAFFEYLFERYKELKYVGLDISSEMILAAQKRFCQFEQVSFLASSTPTQIADYAIASGIFNVRLEKSDSEWSHYFYDTLDLMDRTSKTGFAFNCLTSYSDEEKKRDYLYYANPCTVFDLCKRKYSRDVALLHDYDLYEFTILVRKS